MDEQFDFSEMHILNDSTTEKMCDIACDTDDGGGCDSCDCDKCDRWDD